MKKLLLTIALMVSASISQAVIIDFNSLTPGTDISGAGAVNTDVTFSTTGNNAILITDFISRRWALESDPRSAYRADFNISVGGVSVFIGDSNADSENIYLEAYDAGGSLLDSATDFLPSTLVGGKTLSVSNPNIAYVLFGGDDGSNGFLNSVLFDDFEYRTSSTVPDSGLTVITLGLSLLGLIAVRKRR